MFLLYLDESGIKHIQKPFRFTESDNFVLGGAIVKEKDLEDCKKQIREFKNANFPAVVVDSPIHAVYLNNVLSANPRNIYRSLLQPTEAKNLLADCYEFISKLPIEILAVIIDNVEHRKQYSTPESPYAFSYELVLERFDKIVEARKDAENRFGQINLAFSSKPVTKELSSSHKLYLMKGTNYRKIKHIHGDLTVEPVSTSPLYDIADLICYAYSRAYSNYLRPNYGKSIIDATEYLGIIQNLAKAPIGKYRMAGCPVVIFPRKREV